MEMHQLRYVVAVARTRNFSRAAEQCHVSQPSLSQQIKKLEDELGERLFDRTKREAKLTPACEIDFALASRPIREERLEVRELFSEELLIALPPRHPLTHKRAITA